MGNKVKNPVDLLFGDYCGLHACTFDLCDVNENSFCIFHRECIHVRILLRNATR